jgi:hypothetical protein
VRDERGVPTELRRGHHKNEGRTRYCRKAERFHGGGNEYLRCHNPALVVLMIGARSRPRRYCRVVAGQVCMHRLTVVMRCVRCVEMHVHQRSRDRPGLHEHDERGGGQPAKHAAIVVNCPEAGT